MAGRTLTVALVANTNSFRRGMMSAVRDAQGFQGKMTALGTSMRGMVGPAMAGAAAAAGAFAVKLGVDGVKAAMEEERALVQLETALTNVGEGFANMQVNQFIDDLQFATGVADDELRPAFTRLVTATKDAQEAQDLLSLALDVSAGTGRDLESVTTALSKAAMGQTSALRRLGVPLDAATLKSGDLEAITSELAKTFDGQASAAASTFQGRMKRLEVAASELQEAFGQGVLNALEDSAGGADDLTEKLRGLQDEAENVGTQIGTTAVLLMDVAGAAGDARDAISDLSQSGGVLGTVLSSLGTGLQMTFNPLGFAVDQVRIMSAGLTGNDAALAEAMGVTSDAAARVTDGVKAMGGGMAQTVEDLAAAADEAERAAQEFDQFADAISRTNAVMGYQQALDDLRKSLEDNGDKVSIFTNKGRDNAEALLNVAEAAKTAMESTDSQAQKALYASDALDTLNTTMSSTKMDDGTKAALLAPFQALLDDLQENGINVDSLQRKLDALQSKTVTVTTKFVTLEDGTYVGSTFNTGTRSSTRSAQRSTRSASMVSVGTLIVNSAAGERAEESVPRSLRRLAFVAGLSV